MTIPVAACLALLRVSAPQQGTATDNKAAIRVIVTRISISENPAIFALIKWWCGSRNGVE